MLHKFPFGENVNESKRLPPILYPILEVPVRPLKKTPRVLQPPSSISSIFSKMYERPRAKASRLLAEEGSRHTVGIRPFGALKYHGDP